MTCSIYSSLKELIVVQVIYGCG